MKTENLTKAAHSLAFACDELHAAHSDASKVGDEFAMLTLSVVMDDAANLQRKIKRISDAVGNPPAINLATKKAIVEKLKKPCLGFYAP